MTNTFMPLVPGGEINRRQVLTGTTLGAAGLAMGTVTSRSAHAQWQTGALDLDDKQDSLLALLKIQADLSGKGTISGFGGKAWAWIPGERHYEIFGTYGIGTSRIEYHEEEGGWRFYHREILYYLDPSTGKVLDTWENPMTSRKVEVLHIINDPVHRFYRSQGGPFGPPFPYQINGDDLVYQIDVFRAKENPMKREDYPLHSQQAVYQSAELWGIYSRVNEIMNPDVTSASSHTAWARLGMWLPFMEMGNRPGNMVYHSQSFKMLDGVAGLPKYIREYTEKNYPKFLEAPTEWQDLSLNENTWTYSKKEIDRRRAEGRTGSVFGVPG